MQYVHMRVHADEMSALHTSMHTRTHTFPHIISRSLAPSLTNTSRTDASASVRAIDALLLLLCVLVLAAAHDAARTKHTERRRACLLMI